MSSKQCQIYEEIIEKMENKIKKLSTENRKLTSQLQNEEHLESVIKQLQSQVDTIFHEYQKLE